MNTDETAERGGTLLKFADRAFVIVGAAMVLYHMLSAQVLLIGSVEHQNIHLAFVFVMVFLAALRHRAGLAVLLVQGALILAGLGVTLYVGLNLEHLEEAIGFPEPEDVFIGVIIIVLALEGTRQAWGWTLPIVATIFVLYFFFGHLIPGPLHHKPFSSDYIVSYLSIGLSGVYGTFLGISANQIYLFVVFGSLLGVMNVTDSLSEIGKLVGRGLAGGPAQTAVVSSSLVGMVTGASVANVAITGAFTIPYMKRVGYSGALAGGIEATASTGGQLMPPVMGAAAFLMAFFVGVPYADIMLAGALPAVLFYVGVMAGVQYVSVAEGIRPPDETPDMSLIYRGLPLFIVPLGIITALLLLRFSPNVAAFWAVVAALVLSYFRVGPKPTLGEIIRCLANGALIGARIGVSLCVVGMISQTLITTGLGAKIAGLVEVLSAGNVLIGLFITMIVSIILGCGVPPVAAYSLVAIVAVPSLVRMGVPAVSAHFFCFYFAIISAVTPPVALGALAAAAISGANYFTTSVKAFKLSVAGFIIPYLIVFNPVLNLRSNDVATTVLSLVAIPVALLAISILIYGVQRVRLSSMERLLALVATVAMFAYATVGHSDWGLTGYGVFALGLVSFTALVLGQRRSAGGASMQENA
ncbi:MAG: TRAP transporter permease [Methyloligellaceae bacterium]